MNISIIFTKTQLKHPRVRFLGTTLHIPVTDEMLGRIFDGLGNPIDGVPEPLTDRYADVNGQPINPTARIYPRDYIQTGISTIDGVNTPLRGQKLPLFSGAGMPHGQLAAQIVPQATLGKVAGAPPTEGEEFAIVFAAMGVKNDVADYFRRSFTESGALTRVAMFLNLADGPPVERIVTPRATMTLAEHLAYERDMHGLVVLTDMTNYGEALRQISNVRGEVPSRKGYPGYLYDGTALVSGGPPMGWLTPAYGLAGFGYIINATFLPLMLRDQAGTASAALDGWLMVGLAAVPATAFWVRLSFRWGVYQALISATLLQAIGVALPVLVDGMGAGMVGAGLLGATFMGIAGLSQWLARVPDARATSRRIGLITACYGLGQVLGPLLVAIRGPAGGFALPVMMASAALLCSALFLELSRRRDTAGLIFPRGVEDARIARRWATLSGQPFRAMWSR